MLQPLIRCLFVFFVLATFIAERVRLKITTLQLKKIEPPNKNIHINTTYNIIFGTMLYFKQWKTMITFIILLKNGQQIKSSLVTADAIAFVLFDNSWKFDNG
jgi:hypothetical protein